MVLHRSVLNWRRGWGKSVMDIVYVKLIGCDGVAEICGQLEEGVMVLHKSMLNWKRWWS